jgi:hypothetical protein
MVWGEKLTNFGKIGNNRLLRRTIVFFCLITAACASETLNTLVNASAGFSAAILQQLATVQSDPTPTKFAEKTIRMRKRKRPISKPCGRRCQN